MATFVPPRDKHQVKKLIKQLVEIIEDSATDDNEYQAAITELDLLNDQLAWYEGHSDLTEYDKDGTAYTNYLKMIIPGASFAREDTKGLYSRRRIKLRKQAVRNDLIKYYRYNKQMMRAKQRIIRELMHYALVLERCFGRYGKEAGFAVLTEDGYIHTNWQGLLRLKEVIERLVSENKYIYQAKGLKSPYGASLPINFRGQYKRVVLTNPAKKWLNHEPELEPFREWISQDQEWSSTYISRGLLMMTDLQTLIRLALMGRQSYIIKNNRKVVQYKYTPSMTQHLDVTGKVNNTSIITFANTMARTSIPSNYAWFYQDYTSNDLFDEFLDEMHLVQLYADIMYELNKTKPKSKHNTYK